MREVDWEAVIDAALEVDLDDWAVLGNEFPECYGWIDSPTYYPGRFQVHLDDEDLFILQQSIALYELGYDQ